ncbi:hypothetical protein FHG87_004078 [Trinorchestia longiramus]|nr:hypothetical protein FHG87_004078 [Trinorchestia longiramus]
MVRAVLNYEVRIERMENKRWIKQIFERNLSVNLSEKVCWVMLSLGWFLEESVYTILAHMRKSLGCHPVVRVYQKELKAVTKAPTNAGPQV